MCRYFHSILFLIATVFLLGCELEEDRPAVVDVSSTHGTHPYSSIYRESYTYIVYGGTSIISSNDYYCMIPSFAEGEISFSVYTLSSNPGTELCSKISNKVLRYSFTQSVSNEGDIVTSWDGDTPLNTGQGAYLADTVTASKILTTITDITSGTHTPTAITLNGQSKDIIFIDDTYEDTTPANYYTGSTSGGTLDGYPLLLSNTSPYDLGAPWWFVD